MPQRNGIYNRVYSNEKWDLVNPENKVIIEDFIKYVKNTRDFSHE